MTPPDKSFSGDIDLFRLREGLPKRPDRALPPAADVVPRYRPQRYHSIQLALVIGLFAFGGFICSMFLVDGNDDFLLPHYWPRKSYSLPALGIPQRPATAPAVPHGGSFKSNGDDKTPALQERRVGNCKPVANSSLSLASAAENSVLRR